MKRLLQSTLVILVLSGTAALAQQEQKPNPVQQHNSNAVWFENWVGLSNATMKIVDPTGKFMTIEAKSGTPVFQLQGGEVVDGIYRYELSAATEETRKIVNPVNNGRGESQRDSVAVPFYANGFFVVERGVIITPEEIKEE